MHHVHDLDAASHEQMVIVSLAFPLLTCADYSRHPVVAWTAPYPAAMAGDSSKSFCTCCVPVLRTYMLSWCGYGG